MDREDDALSTALGFEPIKPPADTQSDAATRTRKIQCVPGASVGMALSLETDCPDCDSTEFYKSASMRIHLGIKKKWRCINCEYGFVTINGIDTSV
jgi:hypothetical protein